MWALDSGGEKRRSNTPSGLHGSKLNHVVAVRGASTGSFRVRKPIRPCRKEGSNWYAH